MIRPVKEWWENRVILKIGEQRKTQPLIQTTRPNSNLVVIYLLSLFLCQCAELQGFVRPLLELLNGLKRGRFDRGKHPYITVSRRACVQTVSWSCRCWTLVHMIWVASILWNREFLCAAVCIDAAYWWSPKCSVCEATVLRLTHQLTRVCRYHKWK